MAARKRSDFIPDSLAILFVTPIIKCGSQIINFVFETVKFVSQIINFGWEKINSAQDLINFGFKIIKFEPETINSGLPVIMVAASRINCVGVMIFLGPNIIMDGTQILIDAIVAVFSLAVLVPSFH